MGDNRVRKVVVVGGGTAGWMTAAALGKALSGSVCDIELVESESIGTVGVGEATIPSIRKFNGFLGLRESEFMRKTQATFKLGIEFSQWRHDSHSYMHPFGGFGVELNSLPFHHQWLRLRSQGQALPLADYSLEIQAARQGRFAEKTGITHPLLANMSYAYHLDASLYAKLLREYAESYGVRRTEGRINEVCLDTSDGCIDSLVLDSGERVQGDFFIDCTGFRALLMGETLNVGFEDWSDLLPCDRAWAVPSEPAAELPTYTHARAHRAGWQWRIPLQHRTGNGCVFSSAHMSEDEAHAELLDNLHSTPTADAKLIKFKAGRRKAFWHKNCVAIGLSSGFLEPLESTSIHLIQVGIMRLLGYFPAYRNNEVSKTNHYNRDLGVALEQVRDFIVLHYHANERSGSDFWQGLRDIQVPDGLARKLSLYRESGIILRENEELFTESSWLAVMEGQGVLARDYLPLADAVPMDQARVSLEHIHKTLSESVNDMPPVGEFLEWFCQSKNKEM